MNLGIKKFALFQLTIGMVIGVMGLFWFTSVNQPEKEYFQEAKLSLKNDKHLNKVLGDSWAFGNYNLVQHLGGKKIVTFDIVTDTEFKCVRAEAKIKEGKYAASAIELAKEKMALIPSSSPFCMSAKYMNLYEIKVHPVNKSKQAGTG